MQIEKIWNGLPAPQSIQDRAKKAKGTFSEDAVVLERDKREKPQEHLLSNNQADEQESALEDKSSDADAKSNEAAEAVTHVDLIA